jgi:hypothetical protein
MLFFAPGTFYYRIFLFVNAFPQTAKGSFSAVFDNPDGRKKGVSLKSWVGRKRDIPQNTRILLESFFGIPFSLPVPHRMF